MKRLFRLLDRATVLAASIFLLALVLFCAASIVAGAPIVVGVTMQWFF